MEFEGKTALVTGGAAGIGLATAQYFADKGARVVLADLNGEAAIAQAAALGPKHLGVACDVTDEMAVSTAAEMAGQIDILVCNAGIGDVNQPTLEQSPAHFRRVLDIHLSGSFLIAQRAARGMIERGSGSIIMLASIAALTGLPRRNAYGAAKAGIVAMTKSMACEWATAGIRVNAVAPGYVATELVEGLIRDGLLDAERIKRRTPMARLIEPKEIAAAIGFLASDAASAITGTVLSVDAGWTAYGAAETEFSAVATD